MPGCLYRDRFEAPQAQELAIPGNNGVSSGGKGAFENTIIIRVIRDRIEWYFRMHLDTDLPQNRGPYLDFLGAPAEFFL